MAYPTLSIWQYALSMFSVLQSYASSICSRILSFSNYRAKPPSNNDHEAGVQVSIALLSRRAIVG